VAEDHEILDLIHREELYEHGIGYIDAQLLAASRLTPDATLWTKDKRLAPVTVRLKIGFQPTPQPRTDP
jgi:hypothetical protein